MGRDKLNVLYLLNLGDMGKLHDRSFQIAKGLQTTRGKTAAHPENTNRTGCKLWHNRFTVMSEIYSLKNAWLGNGS